MAQMTAEDRAVLAEAMGADAEQIASEVDAGLAQLLRYADGSRIVLRLEHDASGTELVIVAGAGRDAPGKVAPIVEQATQQGWSVRIHTARPGLGRILTRQLGFKETERVYRYG